MYKREHYRQFGLADFNQPLGFKMNPENRWVKKAETIPWAEIEEKYAALFPSKTGMPAKPLRMALGSLLIQKQYSYSDRELLEQIMENPYYQYFIGLPGFQDKAPFAPSLLVEFRKRLTDEVLIEINEMIIEFNRSDDQDKGGSSGGTSNPADAGSQDSENKGTLILDATCAPQNIEYPQDVNLLNETREKYEDLVKQLCYELNCSVPRLYSRVARKDYLALAKCKKRTAKRIRQAVKKQLQYVRRDRGYIDKLLKENPGIALSSKQQERLNVLDRLYEQQKYMYDNKVHSVPDRIVNISQPFVRPIVRGKASAPVEFGAKLDLSVDEKGMARLEKLSFDAYNESDVLIDAIERYKVREGHYPERVLVDQIYRNRANLSFCKAHGIRISGPKLGRPRADETIDKKQEYRDNTDRIEVERRFAVAKHSYGLGLVVTKLESTSRSSIALSILAMNISKLAACFLHFLRMAIFLAKSIKESIAEQENGSERDWFLGACY